MKTPALYALAACCIAAHAAQPAAYPRANVTDCGDECGRVQAFPGADASLSGPGPHVILNIDWASFLADFDLLWSFVPRPLPGPSPNYEPLNWYTAAFIGNGVVGAMVRSGNGTGALRIDIGSAEVWSNGNRQPLGYLLVYPRCPATKVDMRTHLYNATLRVNVTTTCGTLSFSMFVDAQDTYASLFGVRAVATGAEVNGSVWQYLADGTGTGNAAPVNMTLRGCPGACTAAHTQPFDTGSFSVVLTSRASGASGNASLGIASCAVVDDCFTGAWAAPASGNASLGSADLFIVVVNTQRSAAANSSEGVALSALSAAVATGMDTRALYHTFWWSDFWPASFVSFDTDTALLALYYIQIYRFASGARTRMHDLMGPWGPGGIDNCIGPWCQYAWDMNQQVRQHLPCTVMLRDGGSTIRPVVQVMYYLPPPTNRADILGLPAMVMVNSSLSGGSAFFDQYGAGGVGTGINALWFLRQFHRHILYTGNNSMLMDSFYPLLKQAMPMCTTAGEFINVTTPDGYAYYVNGCYSPEYTVSCGGNGTESGGGLLQQCWNCNYDLSICRWALQTAVAVGSLYAPEDAVNVSQWQDALDHLAPYPVDQYGLRVSRELPFAVPHRHFSHLLAIYDLQLIAGEEQAPLMAASLDRWWNLTCADQQSGTFNEQCRGFTQAGMAGMSAMLNRSDAARGNLSAMISSVITPNGQYGECIYAGNPDEFSPVSESAYAVAAVLHDILLASNHVPAVPQAGYNDSAGLPAQLRLWSSAPWANASVYNVRTEGSFLVSAQRVNFATSFVSLTADGNWTPMGDYGKPAPVVLFNPDWASVASVSTYPPDITASPVPGRPGAWLIALTRGAQVIVYPGADLPPLIIGPAGGPTPAQLNYYGFQWNLTSFH